MKIGKTFNKHQEQSITISQLLLVEQKLTIIDLRIEDRDYLIDLRDIIQFSKPVGELSELDVDTQIEKITSYRFTIIKCIYDFQSEFRQSKRKFKNWYAGHYINIHKSLTTGAINKSRISDKFIEHYLIHQHQIYEEYEEKMGKIDDLENKINFLGMLDYLLSQRLEALRSIGRRRLSLKGGKYESSI